MSLNLPRPSSQYDATNEAQARREIESADLRNRKIAQDVEVGGNKLVLKSPDGTRWNITVDNGGTISATSL